MEKNEREVKMKEKIFKSLCAVFGLVGFVIVLGSAGASDCGTICFTEAVVRCLIGIAMIATAFVFVIAKEA